MPNHVTSILKVSGDPDKVKAMFEAIKIDEIGIGSIDFNKIIPMPPTLEIESGSRTNRAVKLYQDFVAESAAITLLDLVKNDENHENNIAELIKKYEEMAKDDPGLMQLGEQYYQNIQNHGHPTWYQWCIAN